MWFSEGKVAANRAGISDANVSDAAFHARKDRQPVPEERGLLNASVRGCCTDSDHSVTQLDGIHSGDNLDVNQMLVAQHIVLHRQEQLGTPGVNRRVLAEMGQHLHGLGNIGGLVDFETAENHHCDCCPLSFSPRQTRSGVSGKRLIRTPVALYSAFAKHAGGGFNEPSPPPFAP